MPLCVVILAIFFLNERLTCSNVISVCFVLSAVLMVLLGSKGAEKETLDSNFWATFSLVVQPLALAGGIVAMRRMKKMHAMVVSSYVNLTTAVFSILFIWLSSTRDFSFIAMMPEASWFLFALVSFLIVLEQTTKFMAFKYHQASNL